MRTYIVLYGEAGTAYSCLGFRCQTDDMEHAKEQCENAYPLSTVLYVAETDKVHHALNLYLASLMDWE